MIEWKDVTLVIAAGGKSSRMGTDKRHLMWQGVPLLRHLLEQADRFRFAAVFLAADRITNEFRTLAARYRLKILVDTRPDQGPIEALRGGLEHARTSWILFISCDQPFLQFSALQPLLTAASERPKYKAVIPEAGGYRQMLAGLYHRDLLPGIVQGQIRDKRRLGAVIPTECIQLVPFEGSRMFFNVNTPADWRLAKGRLINRQRQIPFVTISAPVSNTGKTTFIERLIPELEQAGLRIGVVKSDCHGYDIDKPGKDSWRFREAGASAVAVVSPSGYFIEQKTPQRAELVEVARKITGVDVILIESRSHGAAPFISLWRDKGELDINDETAAVFTSEGADENSEIRTFALDDIPTAVELILFLTGR